jgi:hypothetical protein
MQTSKQRYTFIAVSAGGVLLVRILDGLLYVAIAAKLYVPTQVTGRGVNSTGWRYWRLIEFYKHSPA